VTWHTSRLAGFDTETTSVDPETARIVTGALVLVDNGQRTVTRDWLTDVGGEDIPDAAAAVHGITTSQARAEGQPIAAAVREMVAALVDLIRSEVPIVAMNARYDFTLLDREMQRLGMPPLAELAGRDPIVLDPLVLDKQADPYRKGKRTLTALCEHYRIQLDDAHSAAADALAATLVVHKLAQLSPNAQSHKPSTLHEMQLEWAAEQAASLQQYLRRRDPNAIVDGRWPLIPRQGGAR
jgi:DNA polymerase-3 subunit epsilon